MHKLLITIVFILSSLTFANGLPPVGEIVSEQVHSTLTAKKISKIIDPVTGQLLVVVDEPKITFDPAITLGAGTIENPKVEVSEIVPYVNPNKSSEIVDNNCFAICRTLGYVTCHPTKSMMASRPCAESKEYAYDTRLPDFRWSVSRCSTQNFRVWSTVTCVN